MKQLFLDTLGQPFGIVIYQLLDATQFTIYLSLIAFAGGGAIGLAVTAARVAPSTLGRNLASGYIWLFQSVPLLMLLFLFGLGLPKLLAINIDPWLAATGALTLYASAYLAEVWRGAVEAVPKGQWESGYALGLRFLPVAGLIVSPQAIRLAVAPTVGFMVQIIKGTSLAFIIGFHDLMAIGKRWANAPVDGTEPFIIFPLMAFIYFGLCFPLSLWSRHLEHKLGSASEKKVSPAG